MSRTEIFFLIVGTAASALCWVLILMIGGVAALMWWLCSRIVGNPTLITTRNYQEYDDVH